MLTSSQTKNGLARTFNNEELDVVLFPVLWVHYPETFLANGLTSDWLYITRVTDVFSRSSSPLSPNRLLSVLSAMMFTVETSLPVH